MSTIRPAVLLLPLLLLFTPSRAKAKNCPSKLAGNLNQVGEKELYWGFELRLGGYFLSEKDLTAPDSSQNSLINGFSAVRSIVTYTPEEEYDWLSFYFEGELKQRHNVENCNSWAVPLGRGFELVPQLRGINVSMDKWDMDIKVGRQNLLFGTNALLDNYFDAIRIKKKLSKKVRLSLFAGAFVTELTREALGCGYEQYYEHRKSWKRLCTAGYGDYLMAGFTLHFRHFRPHRVAFMNLFQYSRLDQNAPEDLHDTYPENLTTNFLSLYAQGPVGLKNLSYEAELMGAYKLHDQAFIPAASLGLRYRLTLGKAHLELHPVYSGALPFGKKDHLHFASLFEGYDLGSRQRYGLYDGQVFSLMARLRWNALRFFTGYHYHTKTNPSNAIDDELEAGVSYFIKGKDKYQVRAIYSMLNLAAGDLPPSHGGRLVLRLIF